MTEPAELRTIVRYLKVVAAATVVYGAVEVLILCLPLGFGWIAEYIDPDVVPVGSSALRTLASLLIAVCLFRLVTLKTLGASWFVCVLSLIFVISLPCSNFEYFGGFIHEHVRALMSGFGLGGEGPQSWGIWTGLRIIGIVGVTLLAISGRRAVLGRVAKTGRSWIIVFCCGWTLWHLAWEALNQWTFTWDVEPTRLQWHIVDSCVTGLLATKLVLIALTVIALLGFRRRIGRTLRGLCPVCAYDLRERVSDGCPECGWGRTSDER